MKMIPRPVGLPRPHFILELGTAIRVPFGSTPLPSVMTATSDRRRLRRCRPRTRRPRRSMTPQVCGAASGFETTHGQAWANCPTDRCPAPRRAHRARTQVTQYVPSCRSSDETDRLLLRRYASSSWFTTYGLGRRRVIRHYLFHKGGVPSSSFVAFASQIHARPT